MTSGGYCDERGVPGGTCGRKGFCGGNGLIQKKNEEGYAMIEVSPEGDIDESGLDIQRYLLLHREFATALFPTNEGG